MELEGLEPPTDRLWSAPPIPMASKCDISTGLRGQEERACGTGTTVEISVPMPRQPGWIPGFKNLGANFPHQEFGDAVGDARTTSFSRRDRAHLRRA